MQLHSKRTTTTGRLDRTRTHSKELEGQQKLTQNSADGSKLGDAGTNKETDDSFRHLIDGFGSLDVMVAPNRRRRSSLNFELVHYGKAERMATER